MTRPRGSYEYPSIDVTRVGDYRLRVARVANDAVKGWRALLAPSRVTRIEVTRYEGDYRDVREVPAWRIDHADGASPWRAWLSAAGEAVVLYADDELRFFSRDGVECGRANVLRLLERDEQARPHLVRSTAGTHWDSPAGFVLASDAGSNFWLRMRWGGRLAFDLRSATPIENAPSESLERAETAWAERVLTDGSTQHTDAVIARAALVAGQLGVHSIIPQLLTLEAASNRPTRMQANQVGLVATIQNERLAQMPRSPIIGYWDESLPRIAAQRSLARLGVSYHPANGFGLLEKSRPDSWQDALARVVIGDRAADVFEDVGAPMYAGTVVKDGRGRLIVAAYSWEYDVPGENGHRTTRVMFQGDVVAGVERGIELAMHRGDELWWG